jgi:hypothetical protein
MQQATVDHVVHLLHYCETFAKQMLSASGEFYPFAAFVNPEGKLEAMAADLGSERPSPRELLELLHGALNQMERDGKLIAFAIAANVDIPKEYSPPAPDGIRIQLVAPGLCNRFVYTPYRQLPYPKVRKFLGFLATIEYEETIAADL